MSDRDDLHVVADDGPADPAMPGTLTLGRVFGIEVGIHYTWLFAFALIAYSLAVGFFPQTAPGLSATTNWILGAVGTLCLFLSVLIHEFSHSLVAKSRGLPVKSITLFIFGGVSSIEEEAHDPGQEFLVAVVGPVASLVLAGLFWVASALVVPDGPIGALFTYLFLINLILGVFNLLPGFPLDGGRVLRALVWAVTGSLRKATRVAATVGQIFAFLLIALGVVQILSGNFLGGLWIAFIGWFLNGAAESSQRQTAMSEAFRGVRVRDVMTPDPPVVEPTLGVRALVDDFALRQGARALLVGRGGRIDGIATLTDVHKVPPERWDRTTVGEIMTPAPLITVAPDVDLQTSLRLMSERDLNQLPVLDRGTLVGLLTRSGVIRFLQFREELGEVLPPSPPRGRPGERDDSTGESGDESGRRAA